MRKTTSAFTIIEVLFAVMLVVTVGFAMLQSLSNNTRLMEYSTKKNEFSHLSSIFALNMDEKFHNKTKSFEELLDNKFKLDDDTRKLLKEKEYLLRYDFVENITLGGSEDNTTNETEDVMFDVNKMTISSDYALSYYHITTEGMK